MRIYKITKSYGERESARGREREKKGERKREIGRKRET